MFFKGKAFATLLISTLKSRPKSLEQLELSAPVGWVTLLGLSTDKTQTQKRGFNIRSLVFRLGHPHVFVVVQGNQKENPIILGVL